MLVSKKLITDDKITRFASEIFNEALTGFRIPLRFERIEFHVRDMTFGIADGNAAIISLDYENTFLQDLDERGARTLITRQIFKAVLGTEDDIEINRAMTRNGYYDDLFYLYYVHAAETKADCMDMVKSTFNSREDVNFIKSAMRVPECR